MAAATATQKSARETINAALADMPQRWLTKDDVCEAIGFTANATVTAARRLLELRIATGEFPKPTTTIKGKPRWARHVVIDWLVAHATG